MDLRHHPRHRLRLGMFLGALSLLTLFSQPGRADLTLVVQQAATAGPPNSEQPGRVLQTITLRFKDGNVRVELPDGRVMLYGKDGIIHTLKPNRKTYITNFDSEIEAADDPLPPGTGIPMTEDTKLDLHRTNMTETILGMKARQYHLTGTVTLTHTDPDFPGGQDGGAGGSGLPDFASFQQGPDGGHRKHGGKRTHLPSGPVISIDGDVWLSEDVKVPSMDSTLPLAQLLAPTSGPLLKPLADTLDGRKALLLQARITVISTPLSPAAMAPDAPPKPGNGDSIVGDSTPSPPLSTAAPPPISTVTTLTLQSYATATLTDTLFQTPSDYNLVGGSPILFMLGAPPSVTPK